MRATRVLITGAARGIGAEAARRLAARGARVALVGHEPDALARTAADCPGSWWREADVSDLGQITAAVDDAAVALGGLDAVVANAGIFVPGTIRTIADDDLARALEVNVLGVARTAKAALPHLRSSRGYLLAVSSVVAIVQAPGLGGYAPSKAAVEAFANVLRVEAGVLGVDVGTAYFSLIDTEMLRGFDRSPVGGELHRRLPPPLGRTFGVDGAADAIVRGVEHHSRRVVWPWWLALALPLRGIAQPLLDVYLRRLMPELDRAAEEDVDRRGAAAASAPVGAGGEADTAARISELRP
jgi:NAD(P)-dependent dehydrogenase (short-subunit alcohol dehydrogenase family)